MNVLVINAGSSSLKFQVIATDLGRIRNDRDELLCRGEVERIGGEAIITVQSHTGLSQKLTASIRDFSAAQGFPVVSESIGPAQSAGYPYRSVWMPASLSSTVTSRI
jgi:acetate kinase